MKLSTRFILFALCVLFCSTEISAQNRMDEALKYRWQTYEFEKAYEIFLQEAKRHNPRALSELGQMLIDGIAPAPLEREKGYILVKYSAELGDVNGQYLLGYYLYNGALGTLSSEHKNKNVVEPKIERDVDQALKLYIAAADKGHELATYRLGMHYLNQYLYYGDKLSDAKQAVEWFEKGKELGSRSCLLALADCYLLGFGVNADPQKAKELFHIGYADDLDEVNEAFKDIETLKKNRRALF